MSDERPLKLLSFDGGGVRGLSSLLILQRLMHVMSKSMGLPNGQEIRPYEYFDMIAGTSTGGLIAIMLGTLRMTIGECIEAYLHMAPEIFPKKRFFSSDILKAIVGKARFDAKTLEDRVQNLVKTYMQQDPHAVFDEISPDNRCRVVVCATRALASSPVLLRSYASSVEPSTGCTVWQAVRATWAAPFYFDPISFGDPPIEYMDGALRNNNPVRILYGEAKKVWGPTSNRKVGCIISIGTGKPPAHAVGRRPAKVVRGLIKICMGAEQTACDFGNDIYNEPEESRPAYFRFNVQGLEDIGLREQDQFSKLAAATHTYLDGIREQVDKCVGSITSTEVTTTGVQGDIWNSVNMECRCHQVLRTSEYERQKNIHPDRVPSTCRWFLDNPLFREWCDGVRPTLLWVSADPWCGKSVLSKSLVDEALRSTEERTTCYFFFKDDNPSHRNITHAFAAILHQLFSKKKDLLKHALPDFNEEGVKLPGLVGKMWNILNRAANDRDAGEIVCILDALDECDESDRYELIHLLNSHYGEPSRSGEAKGRLKFLVTSRPYFDIERRFSKLTNAIPTIRLRGEREFDIITHEIKLVIEFHVQELVSELQLDEPAKSFLRAELSKTENRNYLWPKLVTERLSRSLYVTARDIRRITDALPSAIAPTYEAMLNKSPDKGRTRKLLQIIVAAIRSLTLEEVRIALAIENGHKSYSDLNLDGEASFETTVKNLCGLFVSVIDKRVYLAHPAAKGFLLAEGKLAEEGWQNSIGLQESHAVLANVCFAYLQFSEFSNVDRLPLEGQGQKDIDGAHGFLEYASCYGASHFAAAREGYEPGVGLDAEVDRERIPRFGTAEDGHEAKVKLLTEGVNVDARDGVAWTSLCQATGNRREVVVELLN